MLFFNSHKTTISIVKTHRVLFYCGCLYFLKCRFEFYKIIKIKTNGLVVYKDVKFLQHYKILNLHFKNEGPEWLYSSITLVYDSVISLMNLAYTHVH